MQSSSFFQEVLKMTDSSFKYILILFNLMTVVVVYIHKSKQRQKQEHHVLFVIAHPDDEVMFFRPSLISINKDYFVHLLCLTGKDTERENELKKSAYKFNIHKLECLNNQRLKDSMEAIWSKEEVQDIVKRYVLENNIKAIFTFDEHGVSNHPNHKSINSALRQMTYQKNELKILNKKASNLTENQAKKVQSIKNQSIKIYFLQSVNLIRKYSGILQIFVALLRDYCWINLNLADGYMSMSIYKSQFVWYRKLWVLFSQYTYINFYTMNRIKICKKQKTVIQRDQSQVQQSKESQQDKKKK